jgi:DHA1 family tetracycline resistance protein-like MFS transporter
VELGLIEFRGGFREPRRDFEDLVVSIDQHAPSRRHEPRGARLLPRNLANRALTVILITVALDAVGLGLVLPVLPTLLKEVSRLKNVESHFGLFLAAYALMQFLFSPILGALSDRFGRRPVLLVSLAGAAIDYLFMAFAPTLTLLYVGRVVAGITGANMAVATAYLADISNEEERARRFGFMNACFGVGFVIGPVIGGLVGAYSPRYPFLAAAVFNGLNLALGYFVLPESHHAERKAFEPTHLNPFRSLRWVFGMRAVLPFVMVYMIISSVSQAPIALWVIYGEDRFGWDTRTVGLSFAAFGLMHALAQAFLTGRLSARFGDRGTLLIALAFDNAAYFAMGAITRGWMAFAMCIPMAIGSISMPALQSLLSRQVDEDQQGELQGTLVALMSLASIVGPIAFTSLYGATRAGHPGIAWFVASAIYLLCFPVFWFGRKGKDGAIEISDEPAQDPAATGEYPPYKVIVEDASS